MLEDQHVIHIAYASPSDCSSIFMGRYEPVPFHFKIPHGIFMHEATSVAIDSKVYAPCCSTGCGVAPVDASVGDESGPHILDCGSTFPADPACGKRRRSMIRTLAL